MSQMANRLREIALNHGCAVREETDGDKSIARFSLRDFAVIEEDGITLAKIRTDFVSLKRLFNETESEDVKRVLLAAARECKHCISDKCTTLLMADARTLSFEGVTKKLCSMWGQYLELTVTEESFAACSEIIESVLNDARGEKHADLRENNITYTLRQSGKHFLVGYLMRHSCISPSDEDFVKTCLPKMPALCAALGVKDEGKYIGAVDNFINGIQYDFIFGVFVDEKPQSLPEGATLRRLTGGEWAVYNSSTCDYPSIWRHYTEKFYALEKRGFDRARFPYEYYDKLGNWSDVHIPVDADEPEDAGRVITVERLPDLPLAGFETFGEKDHPAYKSRDFENDTEEIKRLVPDWSMIVRGSVHQLYGRPIRGVNGVVVADDMTVPDGLERLTIKGGLWRLSGRRHFNGWHQDWNFDTMPDKRIRLNECQHPRAFNEYYYNARGGYSSIGIPMRPEGETRFDVVELEPMRVFGTLEDPINGKTVSEAELAKYYDIPENDEKGTLVVGFRPKFINGIMFFAEPLIKGAPCEKGEYLLEGGLFLKIWEANPDGTPFITHEPGWDVEWGAGWPDAEHKEIPDTSRHSRMVQRRHGLNYEYYLPIKRQ